jgi:hypothetical protein
MPPGRWSVPRETEFCMFDVCARANEMKGFRFVTKFHIRSAFSGGRILHTVEIAGETPLYAPDLRGISDQWMDLRVSGFESGRHRPSSGDTSTLFRGDFMNGLAKSLLRVLAVAIGTTYFLSTAFLMFNAPSLSESGIAVGWRMDFCLFNVCVRRLTR